MNGLEQFVTKSYDKTPVRQGVKKMATGKPKSGAGPYAGYKKNYAPIKSSKGTKAEKVVRKVLKSAGGGIKPTRDPLTGKMTKPSEAGLGVVGTMARAAARASATGIAKGGSRKAGTVNKTLGGVPKPLVKKARETRLAASKEMQERYPSMGKKDKARLDATMVGRGAYGMQRRGTYFKNRAQERVESNRMAKEAAKQGVIKGTSNSKRMTTSPTKRKK